MTAPSAEPTPPPRRGRPVLRLPRRLSAVAAVLLLGAGAGGCVTVHGATADVPSVTRSEAAGVTTRFMAAENTVQSKLDTSLVPRLENGPMLAVEGSYVRAAHKAGVDTSHYRPMTVSGGPRLLIPRQVGWPKWFASDVTLTNGTHRLMVFTRDNPRQPWMCSYFLGVAAADTPAFATDAHGYALPVPAAGTSLAVQPGRLAGDYTDYLDHRDESTTFAPGPLTDRLVASRRAYQQSLRGGVAQYADEADKDKRFGPVALRLKDGGAFVFATAEYQWRVTSSSGAPNVNAEIRALMTGTIEKSVTVYYVTLLGAVVPPSGAAGGAKVSVVSNLSSAVSAHGS